MPLTVLLVDDDPLTLKLGRALLERDGHSVRVVSDPAQTPFVFEETIDLVFADYHMPGMTGADLIRALRKAMPKSTPPLVLMSNLPEKDLREKAEGCGADDWVRKPLSADKMHEILRNFFAEGLSFDLDSSAIEPSDD